MSDVGAALLELARARGLGAIAVAGTAKGVGKTVTARAVLAASVREGVAAGFMTVGRDGERVDAVDGTPKPRLEIAAGTLVATGRALLPRTPALEIVAVTGEPSALGPIVIARAHAVAALELSGPPTARGAAAVARALWAAGARRLVVDGAIDRLAALPELEAAVVIATGAARADSVEAIAAQTAAIVARLRLRAPDRDRPAVEIDGALTPAVAHALIAAGERRQVVVRDAARIAVVDGSFGALARALDLRCARPLDLVACTCASRGPGTAVEPRALLRAVAAATGLPAFDVYSGETAA